MIQLDLIENDVIKVLLHELKTVKESSDNVRRGVFARLNEIEKMINVIKNQGSQPRHE